MEKLLKIKTPILLLLFILIIAGTLSASKPVQAKKAEKDAELFLSQMDSLMEYTLPEGWEFKTESASAKRTGLLFVPRLLTGDMAIGKETVDYDEWYYGCIRISMSKSSLKAEEEKEDLYLNFGYSHDNYTFEKNYNYRWGASLLWNQKCK